MRKLISAAVVSLGVVAGSAQSAEPGTVQRSADSAVDSDWSFGMQAAPLIFGLSLRYNFEDIWQIQGVVQPAGDDLSAAVRVLRTSTQKEFWRSYLFAGYAMAEDNFNINYEENALTVGLGVEWSWAAKNPSLPPLSWGLELGLGYGSRDLSFDLLNDEPEEEFFLAVGASIHYHFE